MFKVAPTALPKASLLQQYAQQRYAYTDCFSIDLAKEITLAQFITAFYTTPLFKAERFVLKNAAKRPSTDRDVASLAAEHSDTFAAWRVEARGENQILLEDMAGRTRSWLMVTPSQHKTTLYFGSAVTPPGNSNKLGFVFTALLGTHKLYSKSLLKAAAKALST